MSIISANIGNFFNRKHMQVATEASTLKICKGQIGSVVSPKALNRIVPTMIQARLQRNHLIRCQPNPASKSPDLFNVSKDILTAMGISCIYDYEKKIPGYSLLSGQTDQEIVLNPAKIDPGLFLGLNGKGKISIKNVLKDDSLPFYKLDAKPSDMYLNEQKKQKEADERSHRYDMIVTEFFNVSVGPHTLTPRILQPL